MLIEGTDFGGVAAGLAFGLNADLANELGAPVCVVVKGGAPAETVAAVHVARESLSNKGCSLFGIVVNRAPADYVAVTAERLEDEPGEPIYVLGEQPDLDRPTVGEVAAALGAQVLVEPAESLHREVRDVRVGAMSVEHFIEQLVDGALVHRALGPRRHPRREPRRPRCTRRCRRSPGSCSRAPTRSARRCAACSRARRSPCSRRRS